MAYITGILVDVEKKTVEKKTIENKLNEFYRILKCETIECPTRIIRGLRLIVVCDGEGLIKDKPQSPSIVGISKENGSIVEMIVGNVFLCKSNGIDDFESLSEYEIDRILTSPRGFFFDRTADKVYMTLVSEF